jgi:hypothetical protein
MDSGLRLTFLAQKQKLKKGSREVGPFLLAFLDLQGSRRVTTHLRTEGVSAEFYYQKMLLIIKLIL